MKYISIFGYYGFENTGDDAVLRSLLDDLCRLEETLYIVVFSDNPQKTEALYADAGIHACRWDDHACLNMAVSQSDLLLIGGGGLYNCYLDYPAELLLKGNHRYFSVVTFGLPFLARIWETPCAVIGCGASEVLSDEAREHIGASLPLLSEITVRDEETKNILSAFRQKGGEVPGLSEIPEIQVTADPVFRLDDSNAVFCEEEQAYLDSVCAEKGKERFVIGVALRNWFSNNESALQAVAEAIQTIAVERSCLVLFLAFDNGQAVDRLSSDSTVALRLQELLTSAPTVRFSYWPAYLRPYFASRLISQCDVMIAMRLHPVVMSIKNRIPVIGLMYDRKVRSIMRECGLEEYCLDFGTVTGEQIIRLLKRAVCEERVKGVGAVMRERAQDNIQMVRRLLESVPRWENAETDIIGHQLRQYFRNDIRVQFEREKADALASGDYESVRRMCRLIHPDRRDAQLSYELAFSLHQLGETEEALRYYEAALHGGFSEYWVRYNRSQLYDEMGEAEMAKQEIRRAYEIDPTKDCKCVLAKITGRRRKG